MLQGIVQWVWEHVRGVTLALTITISAFLLARSPQYDLTPLRWGIIRLVAAGERVFALPIHLASLEDENRYLRGKLVEHVMHATELRELRLENERLRTMLDFERQSKLDLMAAQVLAHDAALPPTAITIDVGYAEGVKPDQAVISPEGLIGRIGADPEAHTALVRLITDPAIRVAVVVETKARVPGIIGWDGTRLKIDNVAEEAVLSVGDRVVTSGMGGVFPAGLYVGTVETILDDPHALFKDITLKPGARFESLEEVFVVRAEPGVPGKDEVRDAVGH